MATTQEQDTGSFTNENGTNIFCKYWCADMKTPKALVFMNHGAAEHCLFYGELAERLKLEGYYVFSHDHEGHGQSGGSRMHITDFRHYVRDVFTHVEMVKKKFPDLPVFILGHSMGGAVTLVSVLDRPELFTGMILIAPVVTPEQDTVGPVRIALGKLVAKLMPHFPVLALAEEAITRDKAMVQQIKDDPLSYHGWMKAKWATCLLKALMEIETKLPSISLPFLVLHGGDDRIINSRGSQALHAQAASKDKTIKIFPDAFHQLHAELEPVKSETFDEITQWLAKRVA